MKTEVRNVAAAVIISKDDKIFLARGNKTGVYAECWLIPGGKIEDGETPEQTARREVLEETGLDLSKYPSTFLGTREGTSEKTSRTTGERVLRHMHMTDYKIVIDDKMSHELPIKLSDEHTEYKWFKPSELKDLKLSPPSTQLFTEMGFIK